MRVAIITPYHSETPDVLQRCLDSVANQKHPCTHLMVGDGRDAELPTRVQHIRLPVAHDDYGDTPRLIGTMSAYSQGLCWLDADCWYEPDHVAALLDIANLEVCSVVTATRNLRREDGSLLGICHESNGKEFCDTNCYLVMRDAIPVIAPKWGFKPKADSVIGDRRVWEEAKKWSAPHAHNQIPTINYTTNIAGHYLERNEQPPQNARVICQFPGESQFRSVLYRDLVR